MLVVLLLMVFVVFPLIAGDYLLDVVIDIGITIIAVLGLQIITGFTGQIHKGIPVDSCDLFGRLYSYIIHA